MSAEVRRPLRKDDPEAVHMALGEADWETACGRKNPRNATVTWPWVTCEACLKTAPGGVGVGVGGAR